VSVSLGFCLPESFVHSGTFVFKIGVPGGATEIGFWCTLGPIPWTLDPGTNRADITHLMVVSVELIDHFTDASSPIVYGKIRRSAPAENYVTALVTLAIITQNPPIIYLHFKLGFVFSNYFCARDFLLLFVLSYSRCCQIFGALELVGGILKCYTGHESASLAASRLFHAFGRLFLEGTIGE
jgi:hypothetical protein